MMHGMLYECPHALIDSWWILLSANNISVTLRTPLTRELPPDYDGYRYRGGFIKSNEAEVEIVACPGPPPSSRSPLVGKRLILLAYNGSKSSDANFAQVIGNMLEGYRAIPVYRNPRGVDTVT